MIGIHIVITLSSCGREYETYGSIRSFDEAGRYQLIKCGHYGLYDRKQNKGISPSLISYYATTQKIYAICGDPAQEPDTYFYYVYEMFYDTKIESFSLNDFPKEDRDIFENERFVDLTQNHTGLEKHFQKIIPYKWRKW